MKTLISMTLVCALLITAIPAQAFAQPLEPVVPVRLSTNTESIRVVFTCRYQGVDGVVLEKDPITIFVSTKAEASEVFAEDYCWIEWNGYLYAGVLTQVAYRTSIKCYYINLATDERLANPELVYVYVSNVRQHSAIDASKYCPAIWNGNPWGGAVVLPDVNFEDRPVYNDSTTHS